MYDTHPFEGARSFLIVFYVIDNCFATACECTSFRMIPFDVTSIYAINSRELHKMPNCFIVSYILCGCLCLGNIVECLVMMEIFGLRN